MKSRISVFLILAVIVSLLAGCGGIDKSVRQQAEGIPDAIKQKKADITHLQKGYEASKGKKEYAAFLKPYDDKEKWVNKFDEARKKLAEADNTYKTAITKYLEENRSEDQSYLEAEIQGAYKAMGEAISLAKYPERRMGTLVAARDHFKEWKQKAEVEYASLTRLHNGLAQVISSTESQYPNKKADLEKRVAPEEKCYQCACTDFEKIKKESVATLPDYACFADCCQRISDNLASITKDNKTLRSKVGELSRSYSKTLVDMRVEYYVEIARTSWDESSDWNTDEDYTYSPREVNATDYEYFDALPDDDSAVATHSNGWWGGDSVNIDKGMWNLLNINMEENWNSSHDNAEYWLADTPVKCFHKYKVTENGATYTTSWVSVDPLFYDQNEDNLGMDLVVKPYGYYEEEAIKVATPSGMAYVGNPHYGHWSGTGGSSFWVWYGQYRMFDDLLGGGYRYRYSDWDDWNRNYRGRTTYYGGNDNEDRFGTGSAYTQRRYTGSTYSKSGGFKQADYSVRTAGPSRRAGGPGGGGK